MAAVPTILRRTTASRPTTLPWADSLAAIGPGAVPALIEGLDDPRDGPRWTAAAALGKIGPEANAAVPRLSRMTTSAQTADRVVAAAALWRIARDRGVLPVLISSIGRAEARDRGERYAALDALGEIGPAATEAVPALIHQLSLVSETHAYQVVRVLAQIGPDAATAVEPLERISAHSSDGSLRLAAAEALWRITRGEEGVDALIKELQGDPRDTRRTTALATLSQFGPEAAPAVPAIVELLRSDPSTLGASAAVLRRIGPPADSALPVLIEFFKDDDLINKDEVAAAIRAIDPEAARGLGIR
ncbi:HEAT repeat domain-containing protein [Paludisphaera sp.]|uniref:HEAT repeat domain-containing protein n=1 Tax=Paludisphaera sp. TaxID=2017432 RepID=UPI00301C928C